jgi:hypothetical protein
MRHRYLFVSALPLLLLSTNGPGRALAADEKEACLAAADQGQSLRDDGHYMVARDQFLTCARDVCPKLVHDQCTEWLRQLDEATPTVVFGAKDARGNDIAAARVLSDGKLVTSSLDGKPVPLDPGPHDIRFERDPNESVTVHVVLRTGEKNRDVTATMPSADGAPPPPDGTVPGSGPPPGGETAAPAAFWNARNITSLSLLVGGVAAVGVGAYFGLQSQSEKSDADRIVRGFGNSFQCAGSQATVGDCATLNRARDNQNNDAVLNEVFYVAGGVLVVGAVATWFLWPKPADEARPSTAWITPEVGPGKAGVRVGGAF